MDDREPSWKRSEDGGTLAEVQGITREMGDAIAALAEAELEAGRVETARAILEGLVVTNHLDAGAWALLSRAHRRSRQPLAARFCAEVAARLAPEDSGRPARARRESPRLGRGARGGAGGAPLGGRPRPRLRRPGRGGPFRSMNCAMRAPCRRVRRPRGRALPPRAGGRLVLDSQGSVKRWPTAP